MNCLIPGTSFLFPNSCSHSSKQKGKISGVPAGTPLLPRIKPSFFMTAAETMTAQKCPLLIQLDSLPWVDYKVRVTILICVLVEIHIGCMS